MEIDDSRDVRVADLRSSGGGIHKVGARGLLLVSLSRFYSDERNMAAVLPYISGDSHVSLRLIDWFVTNYAKKHNVFLARRDSENGSTFNVYQSYQLQLKAVSKKQFDPFRRGDHILFRYSLGTMRGEVETTVGQLNFFRWMLESGILDYVGNATNAAAIDADMVSWNGEDEVPSVPCRRTQEQAVENHTTQRRSRSEMPTNAPTLAMMRIEGARTMAFE